MSWPDAFVIVGSLATLLAFAGIAALIYLMRR